MLFYFTGTGNSMYVAKQLDVMEMLGVFGGSPVKKD
jgi:hypothetical protein